jgi:hypothetical protein
MWAILFRLETKLYRYTRKRGNFRSLVSHRSELLSWQSEYKQRKWKMNRPNIGERGSEVQKFSTKNSLHLSEQTRVCTVQRVEGVEAESEEKIVSLLLTASLFPIDSASLFSLTSLQLLDAVGIPWVLASACVPVLLAFLLFYRSTVSASLLYISCFPTVLASSLFLTASCFQHLCCYWCPAVISVPAEVASIPLLLMFLLLLVSLPLLASLLLQVFLVLLAPLLSVFAGIPADVISGDGFPAIAGVPSFRHIISLLNNYRRLRGKANVIHTGLGEFMVVI